VLHLGHRESLDFDFFGNLNFDPARLREKIPFLSGVRATQQEPNTLSAIIHRDGPVKVSFFGVPGIRRIKPPHIAPDNGLRIASLLDLAGTKAAVVQQRAEAKDYLDIDAILRDGQIDLPTALAAARIIYGPVFNPQITLKALSFFAMAIWLVCLVRSKTVLQRRRVKLIWTNCLKLALPILGNILVGSNEKNPAECGNRSRCEARCLV